MTRRTNAQRIMVRTPTGPITEPGFYEMSAKHYHADPCAAISLNSSIAKPLVSQSPAHAHLEHPRLRPAGEHDPEDDQEEAQKRDKERGLLMHRLLLGKGSEIEPIEFDNYRKAAAQDARAAARKEGRIPVLAARL